MTAKKNTPIPSAETLEENASTSEAKKIRMNDPSFDWSKITDFSQEDYIQAVAKHGEKRIYHLHIEVDEEEKYDYLLVRPSKQVMSAVAKYGVDKYYDRANNFLIKNCTLAGDMQAMEDDAMIFTEVLKTLTTFSNQAHTFFSKA